MKKPTIAGNCGAAFALLASPALLAHEGHGAGSAAMHSLDHGLWLFCGVSLAILGVTVFTMIRDRKRP